jgi:hypothetical protein
VTFYIYRLSTYIFQEKHDYCFYFINVPLCSNCFNIENRKGEAWFIQFSFLTSSWCCMKKKNVTVTVLSIKVASTCYWKAVVDPVTGLLQIEWYNSAYVKGADYSRSVFVIYNIFTNGRYEVYANIPFNLVTGNILNSKSIVVWDVIPCTLIEVCWHFMYCIHPHHRRINWGIKQNIPMKCQ